MLSKVFVRSQSKLWLECAYSLVHEEIRTEIFAQIETVG